MHRHSIEFLVECGDQRYNLNARVLPQQVQRPRAILATGPRKRNTGHSRLEHGTILYMERLAFHFPRHAAFVMPKPSKLKLRPLSHSVETPGQCPARIRRERGFTQFELAEKTGLVQTLVSDYEHVKPRLNAGMILRFATALEVSTDALLQPAGLVESKKPSRQVLRRLEQIEALPAAQQTALLRTIDTFLEGAAARRA